MRRNPATSNARRSRLVSRALPAAFLLLLAAGCGGPDGPGITDPDDGFPLADVRDAQATDPGRPDPGGDPGNVDPGHDPGEDPGGDPGEADPGFDWGGEDPGVDEGAGDDGDLPGEDAEVPPGDDGPADTGVDEGVGDDGDLPGDALDVLEDAGGDAGPACTIDADCDDQAPCTIDTCEDGVCRHVPVDCDDGNPCTVDVCGPLTGECVHVNPCDDGDACTEDDCVPATGECLNTPVDCSDDNLCTMDDCLPTTGCFNRILYCDSGDPCTTGWCDPSDGSCRFEDVVCEPDDLCHEAWCNRLGAGCEQDPIVCNDLDPCTFDGCDPYVGCTYVRKDSSDGDPCTIDSCDPLTGEIRHDPVACEPMDPCHDGSCDPVTGACIQVPRDCADLDPCTIDTCDVQTGECLHQPKPCEPADACQEAWCDALTGDCLFRPVDCDDGDACTLDGCDPLEGCIHDPRDCDDMNACTLDGCDPATGCTGSPVNCDDGDPLTMDGCDPASGCVHAPIVCDDEDACTVERWDEELGCLYQPIDCDDGNACTVDGCDPQSGCTHEPADCDDADLCTTDTCDPALGCIHHPVPCMDEDPCTVDSCDPQTGSCVHEPLPCEPPDICHVASCIQGACQFLPIDCDDGDAGTVDGCDPATGCTHTPVDCDDGDACTTDTHDPLLGCVHAAVDCDDLDACTTDACDPATGCTHAAVDCDDLDACTTDACDPATGCVFTTKDSSDGDLCTIDSCDPLTGEIRHDPVPCDPLDSCHDGSCNPMTGACVQVPRDCDDLDACTTDACDPATGCTHQWICGGDEICDNGFDDDDNGLRDCADPACIGTAACLGDTCDDPWILSGTAVVNVDTRPLTGGVPAGCEALAGTDIVFQLDVPVASDVHVSTLGSDYDTAVSLRAAPCTATTWLACNDDIGPFIDASRVEVRSLAAGTWFLRVSDASGGNGGLLRLNVVLTPAVPAAWPPTTQDPLVRMPGTQPTDGLTLETPDGCASCHAGYNAAVEPSRTWRGSMMAQASRDFVFWASMAVAIQDSLWALGTPNAADLCERCHFPQGWVEGRSDPPNASAMRGFDYDGVHCDVCHSMVDPHFEATFAGTREGSDWTSYWDETNLSGTPSSTAADATRAEDRTAVSAIGFYNGTPYFGPDFAPLPPAWDENASGQFFLSSGRPKRAPFADAGAKHQILYSRHHKSRYFCGTCHDVTNPALSNLDFAGLPPGDGTTELPSETLPAWDMTHVERTFSEFMLSAYGLLGGAPGTGAFDPAVFSTSQPGNAIASCQDCHMADLRAVAANKTSAVLRPDDSIEHPASGMPDHSMAGGNPFVLRVLASTVAGSPNYDAVNAGLLTGKATTLTMDLAQGLGVDPVIALEGADKALAMLEAAASIDGLVYSPASGTTTFRVINHTGHKLLTGFPEGRRVFVNVRAWQGDTLIAEINPYDAAAGTLKGLPAQEAPASPPTAAHEAHVDDLVYECRMGSSLTGEDHTFHFVLSTHRVKDNRVPPRGFRIAEAPARKAEPVHHGDPAPGLFSPTEYAGGHDDVTVALAPGASRVEVTVYYQATSREYVEFLRDELTGMAATLSSPTPAGGALTYVSGDLPFFDALRGWGDTIWQLWSHNRNVPGAAPVPMAQAIWTP